MDALDMELSTILQLFSNNRIPEKVAEKELSKSINMSGLLDRYNVCVEFVDDRSSRFVPFAIPSDKSDNTIITSDMTNNTLTFRFFVDKSLIFSEKIITDAEFVALLLNATKVFQSEVKDYTQYVLKTKTSDIVLEEATLMYISFYRRTIESLNKHFPELYAKLERSNAAPNLVDISTKLDSMEDEIYDDYRIAVEKLKTMHIPCVIFDVVECLCDDLTDRYNPKIKKYEPIKKDTPHEYAASKNTSDKDLDLKPEIDPDYIPKQDLK